MQAVMEVESSECVDGDPAEDSGQMQQQATGYSNKLFCLLPGQGHGQGHSEGQEAFENARNAPTRDDTLCDDRIQSSVSSTRMSGDRGFEGRPDVIKEGTSHQETSAHVETGDELHPNHHGENVLMGDSPCEAVRKEVSALHGNDSVQLDATDRSSGGTTVKCAGCGKVWQGQARSLPHHANKVLLSLCDDCENFTSAMFVCMSCGQECNSLAALRAHKQTHVVPENRIYVCEMCGVGFRRQIDLEVHSCAVVSNNTDRAGLDGQNDTEQEAELMKRTSQSRRKPRITQKVRVEAIVKTLSKRTQGATKKVMTANNVTSSKKTPPTKRSAPSKRTPRPRKKQTSKPSPPPALTAIKKTTQSARGRKITKIKFLNLPPMARPKPPRKVLKVPKVFECKDCSEFFTDSKELRKHNVIHKKKETFSCDTCKKEFKSKRNLTRHELSHSEKTSDICDICDKKFQSLRTLFTHKKTVHNDEKPYVCDICHKDFKQLGNMKTHRRTHTGERPFVCQECGRAFAQMGNLQAHMVIHAASKPHVCEICGKSFSYLRSLQNHMRGTHTGERPFACNTCGKTFSNQSVLRDHRRTHSDKRGYLCDKCGKGFKSYKNLKQHEKFHLEVRPYKCQVCGKGFVWFKSFQLHKRTHTGEKPYACQHCEKVFSNINSLKNHAQKHLTGYTAPPPKSRSTAKAPVLPAAPLPAAPPPHLPPPPPPATTLPAHQGQHVLIPHPGMHQGPGPRDHMVNSLHPHPSHTHTQVTSSSPGVTPPMHPAIPPHSQAYGHVVFPQPYPSFVTNAGGDFTIL